MEVILKEDVKNIGKAGQVIKVSEGYARNFLIPQNKAVIVTAGNMKALKEQIEKKQVKRAGEEKEAQAAADKLKGVELTIKKKASDDDKLFGSVAEADIASELSAQGFKADKSNIVMERHIKELGVFTVTVRFKAGIEAPLKVWVVREGGKKG